MTATFSVTCDQVVSAAIGLTGAIAGGETADATELNDGRFNLNVILKGWADKGYKGWLYQTKSFPVVLNQPSYTIGESGANVTNVRPERIAQAWWGDTATPQNTTPMTGLAREQFNRLTPKLSPGTPTSWYYDPQLLRGVFYVWPVPNAANIQDLLISLQRPINDLTSGSDTFDIPQQVYKAVTFCLARDWAIFSFRTDERMARRIESRADMYEADAMNYQEEDASVYFTPNPQGGFWGPGAGQH
jgi:hypothetical protein